jgi:Na+/H+ antiporter NhaC
MKKSMLGGCLPFLLATVWFASASEAQEPAVAAFEIEAPELVLTGVRFPVEIRAVDAEGAVIPGYQGAPTVTGIERDDPDGRIEAIFEEGNLIIIDAVVGKSGTLELEVRDGEVSSSKTLRVIPGVLSILPPIFAIAMALIFRQVVISLYAGIWLGAVFVFDFDIIGGFFRVLDHYIVNSMTNRTNVQIMLFSMFFAGVMGLIARNGGARGIANVITRYAKTARGGELACWFTAIVLFFDDYSSVLIRGNLLRPITDKLRISREKLSFYVDTGAATVASLFLISTWIGYEVGLIQQALQAIDSPLDAYAVFVRSIPYRFYPIFALVLAFLIASTGRDFGPMLAAERRARRTGKVLRDGAQPVMEISEDTPELGGDAPARWYNGLLPIISIVLVAMFGLYWTGTQTLQADGTNDYGLGQIVSNADSYVALLWASLSGCVVAIALSLTQRILSITQAIDALLQGMKFLLLGIVILVLAWSIGSLAEELHTADYLIQQMRGNLSPFWVPSLTFLIAALMSFATGTSWATMAILMPLVIPLVNALGLEAQLSAAQAETVLLGSVSSVLAGAVFGDHCSPISDTTILSSMSSGADHVDHVRTQLPYALLAAIVGILVGDIPSAYGISPWISMLVGVAVMIGVLFAFGKKVETE